MTIEERLIRGEYSQVECYEIGKLDAFNEMKVEDKGYQIGYKQAIDKACKWMRTKMNRYIHTSPYGICVMMDEAEEAFRKAMEDKV